MLARAGPCIGLQLKTRTQSASSFTVQNHSNHSSFIHQPNEPDSTIFFNFFKNRLLPFKSEIPNLNGSCCIHRYLRYVNALILITIKNLVFFKSCDVSSLHEYTKLVIAVIQRLYKFTIVQKVAMKDLATKFLKLPLKTAEGQYLTVKSYT